MVATLSTSKLTHLTLYRGFQATPNHVWSPFVAKVEARLRFADASYTVGEGSPRGAPTGKIPYITLDGGATTLGDSTLMIGKLVERGILPDLNARLGPLERFQDAGLRALLEDKLYFLNGWEKWTENFAVQRGGILWSVPWPMRSLIGFIVRRASIGMLKGQGTGRYSGEQIALFQRQTWDSIAGLVEASRTDEGVFWALGGGEPTEADATLFGFIASVLVCTSGPKASGMVREYPVVMEYASRIHDTYFSDYEKWLL